MQVLVLSTGFEPMYKVSWRRAMTLWVAGRVEVVEHYADRVIQTVTDVYRLPAVVRFVGAMTPWRGGLKFSRDNVYARDRGRCQYCDRHLTKREATYDHVKPRAAGGRTRWENIVLACITCNQHKSDRTPEQARMPLKTRPVKPRSLPTTRDLLRFEDGMPEAWQVWLPAARSVLRR